MVTKLSVESVRDVASMTDRDLEKLAGGQGCEHQASLRHKGRGKKHHKIEPWKELIIPLSVKRAWRVRFRGFQFGDSNTIQ